MNIARILGISKEELGDFLFSTLQINSKYTLYKARRIGVSQALTGVNAQNTIKY